MGLIVIHIDTQKDTSFLTKCYEGLDAKVFVNPTKEEVNKVLKDNPDDKVMMMGHGFGGGLFSATGGNVIDFSNVNLLKGRECIGIWCFASDFAKTNGLKGYFTSMFISNGGEARSYHYTADEEDVFNEVVLFAERVNKLLKDNVPLDEWVERLQEEADYSKGFVEFNYSKMEYFDGTQEEEFAKYAKYDNEVDIWFDDFCLENDIKGEWAKEIAYPIFVAGWESYRTALYLK
jgi:hypothetical protein